MAKIKRREFIAAMPIALSFLSVIGSRVITGEEKMYGLMGKMTAAEGKRDELIKILLDGTKDMPGCLIYIVSKDSKNAVDIWINEVWKDQENHKNSLSLPGVKKAIEKGRPLIAGFGEQIIVEPVGGQGLVGT